MTSAIRRSLLIAALIFVAASASAQTGTPPFGTFGGGPDVINLANLNSHITVPVFHKPGRGLAFDFSLTYDSSIWSSTYVGSTVTWQPRTDYSSRRLFLPIRLRADARFRR